MSADLLRRAAALMRVDKAVEENLGHIDQRDLDTRLAVADWLDDSAERFDNHMARMSDPQRRFRHVWLNSARSRHEHALAVARAYLGESA